MKRIYYAQKFDHVGIKFGIKYDIFCPNNKMININFSFKNILVGSTACMNCLEFKSINEYEGYILCQYKEKIKCPY